MDEVKNRTRRGIEMWFVTDDPDYMVYSGEKVLVLDQLDFAEKWENRVFDVQLPDGGTMAAMGSELRQSKES